MTPASGCVAGESAPSCGRGAEDVNLRRAKACGAWRDDTRRAVQLPWCRRIRPPAPQPRANMSIPRSPDCSQVYIARLLPCRSPAAGRGGLDPSCHHQSTGVGSDCGSKKTNVPMSKRESTPKTNPKIQPCGATRLSLLSIPPSLHPSISPSSSCPSLWRDMVSPYGAC